MQNQSQHTLRYNLLLQYLIFLNIILLVVLPQLNSVHYDPLSTFWGEMIFAWASISLFLLVSFTYRKITIPFIVIPLILFGLYAGLQPLITHIEFLGIPLMVTLEMFICILLAIACNTIIYHVGLKKFLFYLCVGLIIGAMLQSTVGFIQYNSWFKYFPKALQFLVFYDSAHPNTNIFGYFGQRNNYSHYLSWAIFACIYIRIIHSNNQIIRIISIPCIIWLLFNITIAGSRSVIIYFVTACIIALLYLMINRKSEKNKANAHQLFYWLIITLIILVLFQYVIPLLQQLTHTQQINSGLLRISSEIGTNGGIAGRRLFEWKKAFIVFKNNPIFGYGISKLPQQSVYLSPLFPNQPINSGLFVYCHNVILQLMAETGIIGTLIAVGGCSMVIKKIWQQNSLACIIILCMLSTTIVHSMVEYPLWYLYFLGPFILFLSITKPLKIISNIQAFGILIIPIIYVIYLMVSGSLIYQKIVNYFDVPSNPKTFVTQAQYLESLVNNNVLWKSPALHALDEYIMLNDNNTNRVFSNQIQLEYEIEFTNTFPYPSSLLKVAMLYWNLAEKDNAIKVATLAIKAYPAYRAWFLSELRDNRYITLYKAVQHTK